MGVWAGMITIHNLTDLPTVFALKPTEVKFNIRLVPGLTSANEDCLSGWVPMVLK